MAPRRSSKKHSSSARVDATHAASLEESIRKEQRAQWKFLQRLEAEGKLPAYNPPPPQELLSEGSLDFIQTAESLPLVQTLRQLDQTRLMQCHLSQNLWMATNPGYFISDAASQQSATRSDFTELTDPERALMEAQKQLGRSYVRTKNDISEYVEASVSFQHMKQRGGAAIKAGTKL